MSICPFNMRLCKVTGNSSQSNGFATLTPQCKGEGRFRERLCVEASAPSWAAFSKTSPCERKRSWEAFLTSPPFPSTNSPGKNNVFTIVLTLRSNFTMTSTIKSTLP
uniref:Uncharacterized protein n=1 Tax=Micrurus corallinus TaxID=54390 RepID=A0A2D4GU59_MICCO